MKIGCITSYDATTPNGYGVRAYYMLQALERQGNLIEYIGSLQVPRLHSVLYRAKGVFYGKIAKKAYYYERDNYLLKEYSRQISRRLSNNSVDVVLSPVSPASQPIAYLNSDLPVVVWTDATFAAALDFYPQLARRILCTETIRDGIANERSALKRCSLVIYSSEWAAQTALEYYGISPAKVRVVPFGANLHCYRELSDIHAILESKSSDKCKLLFVGAEWYRKGGDIALQVAINLYKAGLDTELTVVGCHPPTTVEPLPNFVKCQGYIDKSTKEASEKMDALFSEAHFLILPTRADCTPNVIPEANSFGVPCVATDVGGIPTMVKDNRNGRTFPRDTVAEVYCQYISEMFRDQTQYRVLALSAFDEYQTRFAWSVNTRLVKDLLQELVA